MKTIELTQGKVALIDDGDFLRVSQFKWHARKVRGVFYAGRTVGNRVLSLHRFLCPDATEVDHKDGNGLNCQRHNLRPATHQQNTQARRRKRGGTSEYRGVYWYSLTSKWKAQIGINGKRFSLGYFRDEEDAALAYDRAAKKFFGEFAALNLTH